MKVAMCVIVSLCAVALAGCSDGGAPSAGEGDDAIRITAPAEAGGPYTFASTVSGDSFTWDLGDRLTIMEGKTVQHTYDFANGIVTVKLTVDTAGTKESYSQRLTIGTGENTPPALIMEAETNWTTIGETVHFTGAPSNDAEGNTMRFKWNCIRTGDAIRQDAHVHPKVEGAIEFGTGSAGSGFSRLAASAMPAADQTISGDMCAGLQATKMSTATTVAGAFEQTGIYEVTVVASDGPNPTISTKFTLYVTDEKPAPIQNYAFTGNFTIGAGGVGQQIGDQVGEIGGSPMVVDRKLHSLDLPINAKFLNFTLTTSEAPGTEVVYTLKRGNTAEFTATSDATSMAGDIKEGLYVVEVTGNSGANISYTVAATAILNMDPYKYY